MATARRVGTNEQILTYGSPGQDYDDGELSVWESATDTDHVTDTETDVLECYDDQANFDDEVTYSGSTNDGSYFRIIRPASGEGHDGTSNNGVYFLSTAVGANTFQIVETFSQVQDLIVTKSDNGANHRQGIYLQGANTIAVGCIVFDGANAGAGTARGFYLAGDNSVAVLCLAENNDGVGVNHVPAAATTTYTYNCISIDNAGNNGFNKGGSGDSVLINDLSDGNTGADFDTGFHANSDYNSSGDGSAPGGNSRTSQTFTFVNAGGNDYHLASADVGAKGFGTDLSADGTFAFDDDIDGDTMSDWPIGFDEPIAVGNPWYAYAQQ